jgi:hypothetical protein
LCLLGKRQNYAGEQNKKQKGKEEEKSTGFMVQI